MVAVDVAQEACFQPWPSWSKAEVVDADGRKLLDNPIEGRHLELSLLWCLGEHQQIIKMVRM